MEDLPTGKVMTGPRSEPPPAQPDDLERVAFERIDAARFYPPADLAPVPIEPGDLPSSYGGKRLVLLPVDPYLIHVYWDVSSTAPPAAGARPVLRFHESPASPGAHADMHQSRPFDVDVHLAAGRWYVHLWSPDKIYCADLGWRGEDGAFIPLARSNTVRTPPAWACPAGPVEAGAPSPALHVEPPPVDVAPESPLPALHVELPPVDVAPEAPPCEAIPVPTPSAQPPAALAPPRADASAHLQRRLAELFAIRGELPPLPERLDVSFPAPFEAGEEIPDELFPLDSPLSPPWSDLQAIDLTQLSEERFTPGVSSEREGSFGK